MNEHVMPMEAKRLASAAGARDVPWAVSYLIHCRDRADAEQSLEALRANCPDQFKQPRAVRVSGRGTAPPAPHTLQSRGRCMEYRRRPYG